MRQVIGRVKNSPGATRAEDAERRKSRSIARLQDNLAKSSGDKLSEREIEVLTLIATDRSTKEMAQALGLSQKTVETHRRNLLIKLRAGGVAPLTHYAILNGYVELQASEPTRA